MGGVIGSWEQLLSLIHLHPRELDVGIDPSPIFPWNNFAVGASTASSSTEFVVPALGEHQILIFSAQDG